MNERPANDAGPVADAPEVAKPIVVAMSGGGYRASIFAIGALLALADRGLNKRVEVISSVSGGSITNAVVAARVDYRSVAAGGLDDCSRDLVDPMTKRWTSTLDPVISSWVWVVGPAIVAFLLGGLIPSLPLRLGLALVVALVMMMFPLGLSFQQQLGTVFGLGKSTLGTIARRTTVHEFCATDLVTGLPLTFSSQEAEVRRRVPKAWEAGPIVPFKRCGDSLEMIVRASAAFPGIPPKLMRFDTHPIEGLGRWALCADGGIWNNLGLQAIEEVPTRRDMPVLCINASALAKPARPWRFLVPGVALVAAVVRSVSILSRNTVEPRLEAISRDLARWHERSSTDLWSPPPVVVADMRPVSETIKALRKANVDTDQLTSRPWWTAFIGNDDNSEIATETKLSRVPRHEAHRVLRRGYANTWLASLLIEPFITDADDSQTVSTINKRLDAIVGNKTKAVVTHRQ